MSMPMVTVPACVNAARPVVDFATALQAYATAHGEMVHGAFGSGSAFDTHRERAGQWYAAIVEAVEGAPGPNDIIRGKDGRLRLDAGGCP